MNLIISIDSDQTVWVQLPAPSNCPPGMKIDVPPHPVREGGAYAGVSYRRLLATGGGLHHFRNPAPQPRRNG